MLPRQSKWKDEPGRAVWGKTAFSKPLQPAAWPWSTAAAASPCVLPRTLNHEHTFVPTCRWATQPSSAESSSQVAKTVPPSSAKGQRFPANITRLRKHAQRKPLLVHHLDRGNMNAAVIFFSASGWSGAKPAPALAGHHQLLSCSTTMRCTRSKPGLRSHLEMCWFAAEQAAEGHAGGTATSSRCSWDHNVAKRVQEETIPWGKSNHKKPFESQGWWELDYNLLVLATQDNSSLLHCISRGEGSDPLSSVSLWNKNLQHF